MYATAGEALLIEHDIELRELGVRGPDFSSYKPHFVTWLHAIN
jgi:hypothetical protein